MTTATGRTRQMDIGKICLMGYRLPGLVNENQSLTDVKAVVAKDFLETIIDALQAEGLRARAIEFRNLTLVEGVNFYTLDTDLLDVIGDAMFIEADETDLDQAAGETPLVMIGRDEWQLLSDKSATGRPTMFYVHKTASPPEVRLWPIPDAQSSGTIRFQIHRLAADSNNSANTVDLERFFTQYLIWELAHQLAAHNSLNMGRVNYFGSMARQKLEICKSYAGQRTNSQFVVRHRTGWSR